MTKKEEFYQKMQKVNFVYGENNYVAVSNASSDLLFEWITENFKPIIKNKEKKIDFAAIEEVLAARRNPSLKDLIVEFLKWYHDENHPTMMFETTHEDVAEMFVEQIYPGEE